MDFGMNFRCKFRLLAASSALFLAAWFGGAPHAGAQEAGNSLQSFLSYFGIKPNTADESIDYRPRAPLAVPPRLDLPQPKEAPRDPSWPKDQDAAAPRRAGFDSHTPAAQVRENPGSGGPAADSRQERGALPADGPRDECESSSGTALCLSTPWKMLKSVVNVFHPATPEPGPEPKRKYLTDPPPGYQRPVGGAKAASEPKEASSAASAPSAPAEISKTAIGN